MILAFVLALLALVLMGVLFAVERSARRSSRCGLSAADRAGERRAARTRTPACESLRRSARPDPATPDDLRALERLQAYAMSEGLERV